MNNWKQRQRWVVGGSLVRPALDGGAIALEAAKNHCSIRVAPPVRDPGYEATDKASTRGCQIGRAGRGSP